MRPPLLNLDLGELDEEPEELYAIAELANIACGAHAGDADSMSRALRLCARYGVRAGAHPSYPDRARFGRVALELSPSALRASVAEQCEVLAECAEREGVPLGHVKAHGALYHRANGDAALARATLGGAVEALGYELCVLGPPEGALRDAALALGLAYLREGFADRGVRPDGSLVPRGEAGALLTEPEAVRAAARALRGRVETVCVHGDTPGAVLLARVAREALSAGGAGQP